MLNLTTDKKAIIGYCLLLVLTLSYLMRIGYTTSDDVQIAQFTFLEAYQNAIPSGRLTWVTSIPTMIISEISGDLWYRKIFRILWIFALFHSAFLLLRERLAILPSLFVSLIPIVLFRNDWDHHAFNSYPGLVVYGLACYFYSLHIFNLYIANRRIIYCLLSCILFGMSFVTELFPTLIVFLLFYPTGTIRSRLKGLVPHFIITTIFILAYISFKGDVDSNRSLIFGWKAIKTWVTYSYAQIYIIKWASFNEIFNIGLLKIISILGSIYIIIYIIYSNSKLKITIAYPMILWWILFSAWINIPVALTSVYQDWVYVHGSKAYLYSAISNFSMSIAIGLTILYVLKRFHSRLLLNVITVILVSIFFINNVYSYKIYHQQRYSHERWILIDKLAKNNYFNSDQCYLAPWLFDLNGIVHPRTDDYWNSYLLRNWGIRTRIIKNMSECSNYELLNDPRPRPH